MPTSFTIAEIELAINFWCARQTSGEDGALCPMARPLADVYGRMIFDHASTVDVSSLTPEQLDAASIALYQPELPL
jgi:Protein of unknown function (DUF3717)